MVIYPVGHSIRFSWRIGKLVMVFRHFLKEKGIPTMIYYPKPMHKQRAFADLTVYQECPVTEMLCQTVLSLPMHPYMEEKDIIFVVENIKEYFTK